MHDLSLTSDNPFLPFGCAILTYALTIGFTSPSSSLRYLGLLLMLLTAWATYVCLQTFKFEHAFYSNFLGGSSCSIVMKYIEWVLLSRWSFEARGPTSSSSGIKPVRTQPRKPTAVASQGLSSLWKKFRFGIGSCFDERLTHTPWQVKGTPLANPSQPGRIPSRQQFLLSTAFTIMSYGLLLDVLGINADNKDNSTNFSPTKTLFFSRLDELSVEELVVRSIGTLIWWSASFWLLQVIYNLSALVLVLFGLSTPERWAPMFGRISDCWSIRQFWGTFWQQCMRRKLTGLSYYTLHSLLRVPKGGLIARYASLAMVFFWSGVAHIVADFNNAIPFVESGAFRFYMTQAFGIMLEDGVQHLYRCAVGLKRDGESPRFAERILGYAWTFSWLVWTTPTWAYPSMARSPDGSILPISFLELVLSRKV